MDQSIKKKYNYWQWRTLIILMPDGASAKDKGAHVSYE